MNCRQVSKELSLYLDGRLPKAHAEEVCAHAGRCAGCGAELRRIETLKASLGSMPKAEVRPEFRVSFLRALDLNWRKVIRRPDFFEQLAWNLRMGGGFSFAGMARVAVPVMSVFFVIAFWSLAPRTAEQDISLVRGNAFVQSMSLERWQSAADGIEDGNGLAAGQKTGFDCALGAAGEPVTANIADKIILRLDRGTEVYVDAPESGGAFVVRLRRGQVYARTTAAFKGDGLCVVTPFSRSSVTGTEFIVQAWPGGSETRVVSGSVKVENLPVTGGSDMRAVIVRAGEKSEVLDGAQPSLARPMVSSERRAVRRFVANDAPVKPAGGVSVDSRRDSRESSSDNSLIPGLF